MDDKDYEKNLLYLNKERIDILSSREFFCGKKVIKYVKLLRHFKLTKVAKELAYDTYAFFNKKNSDRKLIDLENGKLKRIPGKVVIYTCIYGRYDTILEPLYIDSNCEYYIFTDQDIPAESIWKKADDSMIPKDCNTPALKNRFVKMFPEKFFSCVYSIYIDGNLQIVGSPIFLIQEGITSCKTGIALHLSPRENCIYEEARSVFRLGKITKPEYKEILKLYTDNKMPKKYGMFECNVIVRDHGNPDMEIIMEKWWTCYKNGIKRDQLYFTYVLFMLGYSFEDVVNFGASVNHNPVFIRKKHT